MKKILPVAFLILIFAVPCKAKEIISITASNYDDSLYYEAQPLLLLGEPSFECKNNEGKNLTLNTLGFSPSDQEKYKYIVPFEVPQIADFKEIKKATLKIYVNSLSKARGVNSSNWTSSVGKKTGNIISSTTYDGITCSDDNPDNFLSTFLTNSTGWKNYTIPSVNKNIMANNTTTFFISPLWYDTLSGLYGYLTIRTANYTGTTYDPILELEIDNKELPTFFVSVNENNKYFTDFGLIFLFLGVIIITRLIRIKYV